MGIVGKNFVSATLHIFFLYPGLSKPRFISGLHPCVKKFDVVVPFITVAVQPPVIPGLAIFRQYRNFLTLPWAWSPPPHFFFFKVICFIESDKC